MKKLFLVLLFLVIAAQSFAGGLSAWQEQTAYDHTLEHDGGAGGWVCLSVDTSSCCFHRFYFYEGHIIAHTDSVFFIINERKETIQQFDNEKLWQKAIADQGLDPFWKREYDDNYGIDKLWGPLLFVFCPFPFLLPLLSLFCVISLLFPWRWARGFRKHYVWVYPALFILLLLFTYMNESL
jgi:hypothetical protein